MACRVFVSGVPKLSQMSSKSAAALPPSVGGKCIKPLMAAQIARCDVLLKPQSPWPAHGAVTHFAVLKCVSSHLAPQS